jgi:Mn2+/Fe2+ NRAMP family transporter
VLLALTGVFVAYVVSGVFAHPDWTAAAKGLVVAGMPLTREAVLISVATLATTLAPWGLVFIQSYAVDASGSRTLETSTSTSLSTEC